MLIAFYNIAKVFKKIRSKWAIIWGKGSFSIRSNVASMFSTSSVDHSSLVGIVRIVALPIMFPFFFSSVVSLQGLFLQ